MSNYVITDGELYHYGIPGMRWGHRKAKQEAKQAYRLAKSKIRSDRDKAIKEADDKYNQVMNKKNTALARSNAKYDRKQASIDSYYKSEIDRHQKKIDQAKEEIDFWGAEHSFSEKARQQFQQSSRDLYETKQRQAGETYANKIARDKANIKITELYSKQTQRAENDRNAAYLNAGKNYVESLRSAKSDYRKAKKRRK